MLPTCRGLSHRACHLSKGFISVSSRGRGSSPLIVNFVCQLACDKGCLDHAVFLTVSVREFLNELGI